jgi:hypothetical protein
MKTEKDKGRTSARKNALREQTVKLKKKPKQTDTHYRVTYHSTRKRSTQASALKMETACFSRTLVSIFESTRRHNPEQHRHTRRKTERNLTLMRTADVLFAEELLVLKMKR